MMRIGDSVRIRNPQLAGLGQGEWLGRIVGVQVEGGGRYRYKVRTNEMGSRESLPFLESELRAIEMSEDQLQAVVDEARDRLMQGKAQNITQVVGQMRAEGHIHNREQRRALFKRLDQER